jgi:hypothetical protein
VQWQKPLDVVPDNFSDGDVEETKKILQRVTTPTPKKPASGIWTPKKTRQLVVTICNHVVVIAALFLVTVYVMRRFF